MSITVVRINGESVKLGFDAPENVTILRQEVKDRRAGRDRGAEPEPEGGPP